MTRSRLISQLNMTQYDTGVFAVHQSKSAPVSIGGPVKLGTLLLRFHSRPSAWVWREQGANDYKEIWVFPQISGFPPFRVRSRNDRNLRECHYYWNPQPNNITDLASFQAWLKSVYIGWNVKPGDINLSAAHIHTVHEIP